MMDLARGHSRPNHLLGAQPIALAAAMLFAIVAATAAMAFFRTPSSNSADFDRPVAARDLQARFNEVFEQLSDKAKGLELGQQESIDQLQLLQDQVHEMRKQVAAQQSDSRRLSEQITSLTDAISGLRASFASAQSSDEPAPSHHRSRARAHAFRSRKAHG